ncbi:MAG: alpha/beta hydrolase [Aggregatilineales bacterium]
MSGLKRILLFCLILLIILPMTSAQDDAPVAENPELVLVQPQPVSAIAPDGLVLVGDFYLVNQQAPTVVLFHEIYRLRSNWLPYANLLTTAGFNVLAVDMRGWGQTGGTIDWFTAVDDVAVWMDWLRNAAQVRPDAISMMGSSMGSSIAIVGCANDALCQTAIAVSPGYSYYGVDVTEALSLLGERQMFIVYSDRDLYPRRGVPRMQALVPDNLTIQTYPGRVHGMDLLQAEQATFIPLMLQWFQVLGVPQ